MWPTCTTFTFSRLRPMLLQLVWLSPIDRRIIWSVAATIDQKGTGFGRIVLLVLFVSMAPIGKLQFRGIRQKKPIVVWLPPVTGAESKKKTRVWNGHFAGCSGQTEHYFYCCVLLDFPVLRQYVPILDPTVCCPPPVMCQCGLRNSTRFMTGRWALQ